MVCGETQKKEIATIKPRTIELNLSDADLRRLAESAVGAELTVSQLLESFIGDLVDGTYSNGSDERSKADEWYQRCGYGSYNNLSLLHFLVNESAVEIFADAWEEAEASREDISDTEKALANPPADWNNGQKSDGSPFYDNIEAYIQDLKEEMEDFKSNLEEAEKTVEEYWNDYLKWTEEKNPEKEKEIKAVLEWNEKYKAED